MQNFSSNFSRSPSKARLGFPSTQELLNALPQHVDDPRVRVSSSRKKGFKKSSRWSTKPRGGDDALLVNKQRDRRPEIENRERLTDDSERLLLVLVGLPARGKSIIADKLERFLSWRGWRTKSFSAGEKRRSQHGADGSSAKFFDSQVKRSAAAREEIADVTLQEILCWFDVGGEIAIMDATNSSMQRRQKQSERVLAHAKACGHPIETVFIESILSSPTLLLANMRAKVRASPDFYGLDEAAAMADLQQRITHYEASYQSCIEEEGSFIQLYDLSSKVVASNVYGRMSADVLPFLMSLHFMPRPLIFLSVPPAGEPSPGLLSALRAWARAHEGPLQVLASTLPTAIGAATAVAEGKCEGCDARQQESDEMPDLAFFGELRPSTLGMQDQPILSFYERPDGESCADLVRRLEPSVLEIEKRLSPVMIVAHQATCRALRAYILNLPLMDNLHASSSKAAAALADDAQCLVQLTPMAGAYGMNETVVELCPCPPSEVPEE